MNEPLSGAEFASALGSLLDPTTPPRLAVAVSGGADSMALALLAQDWAVAYGGEILALTVDHGLRPESAAEARQVGAWLAARGIAHQVLPWRGPKATGGLQRAAREARYTLLGAACAEAGISQLLTAHHAEDQAETFLMRVARGSGVLGLSGMAAIVGMPFFRMLRPLLGVPKQRLRALLLMRNQRWVEDPSNEDPRFARAELRRMSAALADEGLDQPQLLRLTRAYGGLRRALEDEAAKLAEHAVMLDRRGFALVDPARIAAPRPVQTILFGWLIGILGGRAHPPSPAKLDALLGHFKDMKAARNLGGCVLRPWRGSIAICREQRDLPVMAGERHLWWDRRFAVSLPPGQDFRVAALGAHWPEIAKSRPRPKDMPFEALLSLPAVYDQDGIFALPHLGYKRNGQGVAAMSEIGLGFAPKLSVFGGLSRLVRS